MLLYVNLIVFFKTEVDSQSQDITGSFKYITVIAATSQSHVYAEAWLQYLLYPSFL